MQNLHATGCQPPTISLPFRRQSNEILTRVADSRVQTVPNFILFCMRPAATLVQIAWD
jgi:hypothetical protein